MVSRFDYLKGLVFLGILFHIGSKGFPIVQVFDSVSGLSLSKITIVWDRMVVVKQFILEDFVSVHKVFSMNRIPFFIRYGYRGLLNCSGNSGSEVHSF